MLARLATQQLRSSSVLAPRSVQVEQAAFTAPRPCTPNIDTFLVAQTQLQQQAGARYQPAVTWQPSDQMHAAARRGPRSAPLSYSSSASSLLSCCARFGWSLGLLACLGLISCCLLLQPNQRFVRHTSTIKMGVTKVSPLGMLPAPGACRLQPACQHRPHPTDRHRRRLLCCCYGCCAGYQDTR